MTIREMFPNLPTFAPAPFAARIEGKSGYSPAGAADAAKRIRRALKARTGIAFTCTKGRGTGSSWLNISTPKSLNNFEWDGVTPCAEPGTGYASLVTRAALAAALGMDKPVHPQGESVAPDATAMMIELAEFGNTDRTWVRSWD